MTSPLRKIALALLEAEEAPNRTAALANALVETEESRQIVDVMTAMASALAYLGDLTPRDVYDRLFAGCPTDEAWREIEERWREERG